MIDAYQLAMSVGCALDRATRWLDEVNATLSAYRIDTPARQAAFLAQIGHESGGMRYVREIWGNGGGTPAQRRYEGRADLGNTQPGDGQRFMGRGLVQITGRANYAAARDGMRERLSDVPDFEAAPEALELPRWAALSAGWYWSSRGLNTLADRGDFLGITKRINGGTNGLAERQRLYVAAQGVLGAAA